ncbi:MAG: anti-sigma factor [Anaerolineae bacterium]|jgi:anti-sigma factor RsiW|nr:anti-sigma factor [Anaerolineae bacterium]
MTRNIIACHYTRARLPAFLHQELPLATRRYVARHIERCPHCRSLYEAHRQTHHDLLRDLPHMGQPAKTDLARLWSRIQPELARPPVRQPAPPRPALLVYGVTAALLLMMILLPLSGSGGTVRAAVPQHPAPQTIIAPATPTRAAAGPDAPRIALASQTAPGARAAAADLDNTPATPEPDAGSSS